VTVESPDLAALPVPTFFEHESGPYITAGVIVARDPETGRRNVSIARLKLLGGNRAYIGIAPNHHLSALARKARARGERLDLAVTVGNHPAVVLASNLYLELGADEYGAAGALLGEPLRVARCERANLEVAAACELVLEGTLDPTEAVDEGPVSEFHGMYERYGRGPVVTFHCLHRRRDAIFQVVEPGRHAEHVLIGAVAIGATTGRLVRGAVPSLERLVVSEGGAGRLSAVIVLRDPLPGDAKKSIFAAWAAVNLLKNVVVVDADVDPLDPLQVEWAISTRVRAERDVVVVPGVRADRSEPLESDGVVTKMGVDATRSAGDRGDWTRALPPAAVVARVRAELRERAAAAEQGRG
jgi:4-hydroxy-3-polyprenylbenzoate decarboxylase